jgi:ectoine hydroxylase-related dioxygenase (phytanoyl-CoA dioxygenase family)
MNDNDWEMERDGGALRLYLGSQDLPIPAGEVATAAVEEDVIDISPVNGRLVLFDSCLVHAVQRNTSCSKRRRALTLWINRPNDSNVRGEVYY